MDASVHETTDTQRETASVAPVDSDSFIDTVLNVAQERADEALQHSGPEQVDSDSSVIDLTTPEHDPLASASHHTSREVTPAGRSSRDRRRSSGDGRYRGRERRRAERRAMMMGHASAAPAQVEVVEFIPPANHLKARGVRVSNWRRIRRAWREWRISRTPRHRHTFGQRLQYRWWRRQDRLQRRRAQGEATRFDLLAGLLRRAAIVVAIAVCVYLVVLAA